MNRVGHESLGHESGDMNRVDMNRTGLNRDNPVQMFSCRCPDSTIKMKNNLCIVVDAYSVKVLMNTSRAVFL